MDLVLLIVGLVVGLMVGGAACWFARGARAGGEAATLAADHRAEVAGLQGQLEQVANAQQILDAAKDQLSTEFQATASRVLQSNNEQFVQLANENLAKTLESAKSEFAQRHQQFQELVKPLAENYGKLNPQIESLSTQVQSVTAETSKLSTALTDNRKAGHWGEVQLRKVAELAGMSQHCDFAEQTGVPDGRPDMIVNLPERRAVVVDAKASLNAYLAAQNAAEGESADAIWMRHARALRAQVDDLSRKGYGVSVAGSLDFVVMFVPGDQFLSSALHANPNLIEYAMSKRIAIATPASLIAMLWAVANGWQQFRLAQDAARIKDVGEEMHKRMQIFMRHYQNVGKELDSAVKAYNSSISSFDQRVVPQGRRFADLVVSDEDDFQAQRRLSPPRRIPDTATTWRLEP